MKEIMSLSGTSIQVKDVLKTVPRGEKGAGNLGGESERKGEEVKLREKGRVI